MPDITERELAATIDHAILSPDLTRADVDAELALAREWRPFSVCVRPADVAYTVAALEGSGVAVGTVIGFPHGTTSTAGKVAETRQAIAEGAAEVDMVLNSSWLRSGLDAEVVADIAAVVEAADGRVVKVIFETSRLTDEEIVRACAMTSEAGAHFVKTSTGFGGGGATTEHIRLMRESSPASVEVKASGGVRSLETALAMLDAGATRLGTSGSATLLGEQRRIDAGEAASGAVDADSY